MEGWGKKRGRGREDGGMGKWKWSVGKEGEARVQRGKGERGSNQQLL